MVGQQKAKTVNNSSVNSARHKIDVPLVISKFDPKKTIEHKKDIALKRFFHDPKNWERKKELEQFVKFHNLVLYVMDDLNRPLHDFEVHISYKSPSGGLTFFQKLKSSKNVLLHLPQAEYHITVTKRSLVLFTASASKDIDLRKDSTFKLVV